MTEQLEDKKEYSLYQLLRMDVFPWIKTYNSYLKLVMREKQALKMKIIGEGKGTTYRIKGENIIKYLNAKSYAEREKSAGEQTSEASEKGVQGTRKPRARKG